MDLIIIISIILFTIGMIAWFVLLVIKIMEIYELRKINNGKLKRIN